MKKNKIIKISLITSLLISSNLLALPTGGDEYIRASFGSKWRVNNNGNYIATNEANISTVQVEDIDANITKADNNANLSVYDLNGTLKNSSDNLAVGDYLDVNNSGVGRRYYLFGIQNQIAGGASHTLALIDGKVYSFGYGYYGALGHGDTTQQTSPKQIEVAGENNITTIAAGKYYSFMLDRNGRVYSFGDGSSGQLGHGDTTQQNSPKQIEAAGENNITAIAAGDNHTLLLGKDGKVYSFGNADRGKIGHGDYTQQTLPKQIEVAGEGNITAIAAGGGHSLLLDTSRRVFAFGENSYGALGRDTGGAEVLPIQVEAAGENNITAIVAGGYKDMIDYSDSFLLDKDEKVYSFGYGYYGELGHGDTSNQKFPKQIEVAGENNISAISAGGTHTLLLGKDGKVYSFGQGDFGALGHGDTTEQNSPKQIEATEENNITTIATGSSHSLLLDKNSTIYSFGGGNYGVLGHGDTSKQTSPKAVSFNSPPTVSNVAISGSVDITQTLTGSYDYSDADSDSEATSTYKWYRADDNSGTNATAITDANTTTYTITTLDSGKYLAFEVTPNDGKSDGSAVKSSYTTMVPIKVDFNSSMVRVNSWNMITVPNERNVSVSNISGATIWTFNNSSNSWEKPTTLTAGKGYMLYTSSSIGLVSADKVSSTITNDYTTIKSVENNNTWTLVGISKSTSGFSWKEIHTPANTLKTGCSYTQIFYYDSVNSTWNTTTTIPYLGAVWVKQNCLGD